MNSFKTFDFIRMDYLRASDIYKSERFKSVLNIYLFKVQNITESHL